MRGNHERSKEPLEVQKWIISAICSPQMLRNCTVSLHDDKNCYFCPFFLLYMQLNGNPSIHLGYIKYPTESIRGGGSRIEPVWIWKLHLYNHIDKQWKNKFSFCKRSLNILGWPLTAPTSRLLPPSFDHLAQLFNHCFIPLGFFHLLVFVCFFNLHSIVERMTDVDWTNDWTLFTCLTCIFTWRKYLYFTSISLHFTLLCCILIYHFILHSWCMFCPQLPSWKGLSTFELKGGGVNLEHLVCLYCYVSLCVLLNLIEKKRLKENIFL